MNNGQTAIAGRRQAVAPAAQAMRGTGTNEQWKNYDEKKNPAIAHHSLLIAH
jgi:hypothetical protein